MSSGEIHVDRCVCHERSLEEILRLAKELGLESVEALQAANVCANGCSMCAGYVRRALRTGETRIPLGDEEGERGR